KERAVYQFSVPYRPAGATGLKTFQLHHPTMAQGTMSKSNETTRPLRAIDSSPSTIESSN
ncbi:MAG TPA: hypothetical protein VGH19_13715, partial [Verrucomicrobiae bacterium]